MFENVGGGEILLILIVVLIFFGPKKIPELAQSLGKGLRKFNDAKDGLESQMKTVMKEPLEAINSAKQGFESKLMDASQPLRESLLAAQSPAIQSPALTPTTPPAPEVIQHPVASIPTPPPNASVGSEQSEQPMPEAVASQTAHAEPMQVEPALAHTSEVPHREA